MKVTISDLVANLVRQADANVEFRLEAQVEALVDGRCTNPMVGKWLDQNDADYLSSVFDLDDDTFVKRFPTVTDVGRTRRQRMAAEIETHLDYCQHCSLRRGYELELDVRIERVFRQNKNFLLQHLEDEVDLSEGEHLGGELLIRVSEHQPDLRFDPGFLINLLANPVG